MKQLSLYAGIEGFGLAGCWLGWDLVASVELEPWCQQVIKHNFPNTQIHGNIKETCFKQYSGAIDIITGGFPCQTFSLAGKGKMDLSLWKEMLRAIHEVKPRWVVAENVYGLVSRKKGMALETVCADLEAEGFTVFPPCIIPACAVGAPHKRERVWIIAYSQSNIGNSWGAEINKRKKFRQEWQELRSGFKPIDEKQFAANTAGSGGVQNNGQRKPGKYNENGKGDYWQNFPTQWPVFNGNDGLPPGLDGIAFSKWNKENIKAGGNAIVPQLFYQIGLCINEFEQLLTPTEILNG